MSKKMPSHLQQKSPIKKHLGLQPASGQYVHGFLWSQMPQTKILACVFFHQPNLQKNANVKLDHFPRVQVKKKTCLSFHHPGSQCGGALVSSSESPSPQGLGVPGVPCPLARGSAPGDEVQGGNRLVVEPTHLKNMGQT